MQQKEPAKNHWEAILDLRETRHMSLGSEIERCAAEHPQRTAVRWDEQDISYEEFNRRANRYAHFFAAQGFVKGDVIALFMGNCPEYLLIVTGLAKIGVITALVHPGERAEGLAHALNLCEARAVILGSEMMGAYREVGERVRMKFPGRIFVEGEGNKNMLPAGMETLRVCGEALPDDNPPATRSITSDDVLVYLYTSGRAEYGRAVPVLHKRWLIIGRLMALYSRMKEDSVQYMCLPLYLTMGFNVCFAGMVASGSMMVLKKDFSVSQFWADVKKHQADYFVCVGEMARYLHAQPRRTDDQDNPLQVVVSNGIWGSLVEPFRRRFGIRHMIETYGKTEGVGHFVNHEELPGYCGNLVLNGIPQGIVVRCDLERGRLLLNDAGKPDLCEAGETGVLLCEINDLNAFCGYLNDPEATAQRILRDVLVAGDCYYVTFDVVTLHEHGYISFVDRLGDTYRWKGKTIAANGVADVICKFFGGIHDVLGYGVQIPGMEGRCGMAAIHMLEDESLDIRRFSHYINRRLPAHARPVFIRICDSLDLSRGLLPWKKILRREGFDPEAAGDDPVYYLDADTGEYRIITPEIYQRIIAHQIKL